MNAPLTFETDDVDFDAYMAEEEAGRVKPVQHWLDQEADEVPPKQYAYPWAPLKGVFPMRLGEMTLWTGYAKHGKTRALMQAVTCAQQQGARVGIISLEFAVKVLMREMRWQAAGHQRPFETPDDRQAWREFVDDRLWFYDHHGMQSGERIAAAVWHMAAKLGIDVIVVDSLMMCGVRSDGEGFGTAQTEFINRLLNIVREHGPHIHLVAHARKDRDDSKPAGLLDVSGHANLVNLPHNVVSFWRNKKNDRTEDALFCVLGDRTGGCDMAMKLWFNATAKQFTTHPQDPPTRYIG